MSDRFVRRPEIVRAYQYRQGDVEAGKVPKWLLRRSDCSTHWSWVNDCGVRQPSYVCVEGRGVPGDGSWAMEDVLGNLTRMSDDHFRKLYQPIEVGCPITHDEALRIAQETLETAERERIEVARAEAKRGIQYKDETGNGDD